MCDLEMPRYTLPGEPTLAEIETKCEQGNTFDRHSVS
jgi:hypothetical protein